MLVPCGAVAGDGVGHAVAMTPDGVEVVAGAPNSTNGDGAAYILRRSGGGWTQVARLTVADAPAGDFGSAVAVSADGNTVLVAATLAGQGKVYVFANAGQGWTQTAEMSPTVKRAASDNFGHAISLSADGGTAAISDPGYSEPGSVLVESRSGAAWTVTATLQAGAPQPDDGFGDQLSLDAAGTRLLLAYPAQSSALVYDLVTGTWSKTATLTVAGSSYLGREVALSSDGATALAADSGFSPRRRLCTPFVTPRAPGPTPASCPGPHRPTAGLAWRSPSTRAGRAPSSVIARPALPPRARRMRSMPPVAPGTSGSCPPRGHRTMTSTAPRWR